MANSISKIMREWDQHKMEKLADPFKKSEVYEKWIRTEITKFPNNTFRPDETHTSFTSFNNIRTTIRRNNFYNISDFEWTMIGLFVKWMNTVNRYRKWKVDRKRKKPIRKTITKTTPRDVEGFGNFIIHNSPGINIYDQNGEFMDLEVLNHNYTIKNPHEMYQSTGSPYSHQYILGEPTVELTFDFIINREVESSLMRFSQKFFYVIIDNGAYIFSGKFRLRDIWQEVNHNIIISQKCKLVGHEMKLNIVEEEPETVSMYVPQQNDVMWVNTGDKADVFPGQLAYLNSNSVVNCDIDLCPSDERVMGVTMHDVKKDDKHMLMRWK